MRIYPAVVAADIPNPGALLGTTGSADLIRTINDSLGCSSFFGTIHDAHTAITNAFIEKVVTPIREMASDLRNLAVAMHNPDELRPLIEPEDFRYTPTCMQLPIVMYTPVRKLLEQGRVNGYGYDPSQLPTENVYERLVNNGFVADVVEAAGDKHFAPLQWEYWSDDPDMTIEEIEAVQRTYEAIDYILLHTAWDPTDITSERG
jgi:hypothetical protein